MKQDRIEKQNQQRLEAILKWQAQAQLLKPKQSALAVNRALTAYGRRLVK